MNPYTELTEAEIEKALAWPGTFARFNALDWAWKVVRLRAWITAREKEGIMNYRDMRDLPIYEQNAITAYFAYEIEENQRASLERLELLVAREAQRQAVALWASAADLFGKYLYQQTGATRTPGWTRFYRLKSLVDRADWEKYVITLRKEPADMLPTTESVIAFYSARYSLPDGGAVSPMARSILSCYTETPLSADES